MKSSPKIILTGAVLAGGKSTRMGRNKALLRVDGEPLWRRQLRVLKEAGAKPVFLVQAPGQRALTHGVLRDTIRDAGPLAGLHAALAQCPGTHLAVVAVDMPRIEADWFTRLAKLCRLGRGVIVRTRDGYEPLAAIYPVEALDPATIRLESGEFALQKFVAALVKSRCMRLLRLKSTDRIQLSNWNSPEDVALRSSETSNIQRSTFNIQHYELSGLTDERSALDVER